MPKYRSWLQKPNVKNPTLQTDQAKIPCCVRKPQFNAGDYLANTTVRLTVWLPIPTLRT